MKLFRTERKYAKRCPWCAYDTTGLPGELCPECGRNRHADVFESTLRPKFNRSSAISSAASVALIASVSFTLFPLWLTDYAIISAYAIICSLFAIVVCIRLTLLLIVPIMIVLVLATLSGCMSMVFLADDRLAIAVLVVGLVCLLPSVLVGYISRQIVLKWLKF